MSQRKVSIHEDTNKYINKEQIRCRLEYLHPFKITFSEVQNSYWLQKQNEWIYLEEPWQAPP